MKTVAMKGGCLGPRGRWLLSFWGKGFGLEIRVDGVEGREGGEEEEGGGGD